MIFRSGGEEKFRQKRYFWSKNANFSPFMEHFMAKFFWRFFVKGGRMVHPISANFLLAKWFPAKRVRGWGGYPPFPLRKKTFFFSHWFSVKGGGVPPNSAKEKNLLFRSKNSIFCLSGKGGYPPPLNGRIPLKRKWQLPLEDVNIPNRFKRHESGDYDPSQQLDSIKGLLFIQNSRYTEF